MAKLAKKKTKGKANRTSKVLKKSPRGKWSDNVVTKKPEVETRKLRKALQNLTNELKEKTHELEIESSLERVRTQAMRMKKPADLLDICENLFTELQTLGFSELRNTMINIHNDEQASFLNYDYSDQAGKTITNISYNSLPEVAESVNQIRKSNDAFASFAVKGKELNRWKEFRRKNGEQDDPRIEKSKGIHYYFYSVGIGAIGISTFNSIREEKVELLKRFRNVFKLSYQRYIDISTAEAQVREAQIEAALESVRSRTIGMQKSDELQEVINVVFSRLKSLHLQMDSATMLIINEETGMTDYWIASDGFNYSTRLTVPRLNDGVMARTFDEAWRTKTDFTQIFGREDKNEYLNFLFTHSDFKWLPEERKQFLLNTKVYNLAHAFTKNACIVMTRFTENVFSDSDRQILARFAKIFDQTYTRFLDLQKAEVQAREAQIEAALERVRAKTMAMQRSNELPSTAALLFNEFKKLVSQELIQATIGKYDEEKNEIEFYATHWEGGGIEVERPAYGSMDEPSLLKPAVAAWRAKTKSFVVELTGDRLQQWVDYRNKMTGTTISADDTNGNRVISIGFFSKGHLSLSSPARLPEETIKILERFAEAFDLTYTRFLDLQKAEAQAREAQIEAALEKVRSRTLAMQKSDELAETSSVLFKQMIGLGISPNRLYINIIKDERGDAEFWITDEDGSKISFAYNANLNDNATFKKMYDGWKAKNKSLIIDMQDEELQEYFNYLSSLHVPFKGGLSQKRRVQHLAYFSKGFIGMASPDEQPTETMQLLERFAYVFNLTFTRFHDLQIAEAHALQAEQDLIEIKSARKKAEDALIELQATQKQLIHAEKMASLGELTAGIAHEIQNPLNFVNNFSEVSNELIADMKIELAAGNRDLAIEIANDIAGNLAKINHHGKRAADIVKGMLQHSRTSSGQKELTDINTLCDEYLRLAYHGLRAKDKSFNAKFEADFDASVSKINVIPQDIGRVILNLINNAFYAVNEKAKRQAHGYEPAVKVITQNLGNKIEIHVQDNGSGIPDSIKEKIFQPFFTTKPTGQGTGLGLSLAFDIVAKGHGGALSVKSHANNGAVFIITLPAQ